MLVIVNDYLSRYTSFESGGSSKPGCDVVRGADRIGIAVSLFTGSIPLGERNHDQWTCVPVQCIYRGTRT